MQRRRNTPLYTTTEKNTMPPFAKQYAWQIGGIAVAVVIVMLLW